VRQLFASVGLSEVENRTDRHYASGVNRIMRHVIVTLNVFEVDRFSDTRLLIKIGHVVLETGVIENTAHAALEVNVIDDIKADQGAEQSPVGLDDMATKQITLVR